MILDFAFCLILTSVCDCDLRQLQNLIAICFALHTFACLLALNRVYRCDDG